ncbi:MAG: hypothetical protein Q9170_002094 [Blastenia crenularia]
MFKLLFGLCILRTAVWALRDVLILTNFNPETSWEEDTFKQVTIRVIAHTQLHIGSDAHNSALRVQIKEFTTGNADGSTVSTIQADATDYGTVEAEYSRFDSEIRLGQIEISNTEFIDVNKNGAGIVQEIITDPFGPFTTMDPLKVGMYKEPHSDCIRFVQELESRLFPGRPPNADLARWSAEKAQWHNDWSATADPQPMKISATKINVNGDPSKNTITRYTIPGPHQIELEFSNMPQGAGVSYADERTNIAPRLPPLIDPAQEGQLFRASLATGDGGQMRNPLMPNDVCRRDLGNRQCSDGSSSLVETGRTDVVFARVNKVLSTVKLVSQEVAEAAGAAGLAFGAAFVILDFIHGEWVGGAFGAAGLALGIAATIAVAGPVGWLLGGLVSALFAILPGLFSEEHGLPRINNMTETIQYKMLGQPHFTGNEECRKKNPSCQAVYGPGTLSAVFQWDNFDAIAFLIHFNAGYPMSIPDMASAFQFNGSGNPSVATVDCHNHKQFRNNKGLVGDDPDYCHRPAFAMSKDFVLPVINQIAASVYSRIIPAPGGDCKLIDAASNVRSIPVYNLTITGLPVSIACNLSDAAAGDPSIPLLGANGYANASDAIVSPANDSTAHQAGAYIAPPTAVPFAVAFNTSNAVCISSAYSASFCLPDGTYDQPTGVMGYTITSANAVSIPPGGSLKLQQAQRPRATPKDDITFTTSQDSSSTDFAQAITGIKPLVNPNNAPQFTITLPSTNQKPPAACFFTKAQYRGDVFCLGPGGAPFQGAMINATYSIGVYGGPTVWIYAEEYGDAGGQKLNGNVPDLDTEPYGTDGNFGGRILAAWIYVG